MPRVTAFPAALRLGTSEVVSEEKAVSDSLNQKPVEPELMDSPGAKIRINHRQHPRAKRLTGSKQKLTELGLIAHTTNQ
jgi:hypothetical protein